MNRGELTKFIGVKCLEEIMTAIEKFLYVE